MQSSNSGPLSHGQLSDWRDVEGLPRHRWHEANIWVGWSIPDGVDLDRARRAVLALGQRHPSLRTRYDLSDPASPRQLVDPVAAVEIVEGDVDGDPMAEITALVNRPFDLRTEHGWRVRLATRHGRPTDLLVFRHHIVADGWCNDVLEQDFHAFLRDPTAVSVAAGPLDLATWQHAAQQQRTRAAVTAYWEKVFDLATGSGFPRADPAGAGALRCAIRSRAAHAHATAVAARTGTSLSSVVLAAYTLAVARVAGTDALVAQAMCANRFAPQWRQVVTTMNQWAAILVEPVDDLAEHATRVHRAVMTSYRYGMYDVDTVAGLRAAAEERSGRDAEALCSYNFVSVPEISGPPPADDELFWDEPFSTVGHGCYLRATEEAGSALALRIRTKGIDRERVTAVMKHLHAVLAP
jgi:hypothetical protein